jgi:hypothetical protein
MQNVKPSPETEAEHPQKSKERVQMLTIKAGSSSRAGRLATGHQERKATEPDNRDWLFATIGKCILTKMEN